MNYNFLKKLILKLGKDEFLVLFQSLYSELKLYNMSVDWVTNSKYLLKFKGVEGDLIVQFE